jgi:hypothetical protein
VSAIDRTDGRDGFPPALVLFSQFCIVIRGAMAQGLQQIGTYFSARWAGDNINTPRCCCAPNVASK